MPPQRVWVLSRFGLKTDIDFEHFGLKLGMLSGERSRKFINLFFFTATEASNWWERKRMIMYIFPAKFYLFIFATLASVQHWCICYARSGLKTGCGKWHFLVWNWVWIWRGEYTPHQKFQGVLPPPPPPPPPPQGVFKNQSGCDQGRKRIKEHCLCWTQSWEFYIMYHAINVKNFLLNIELIVLLDHGFAFI